MMKRLYAFLIICIFVSVKGMSQPGTLDYTFTTDFSSIRSVMTPAIVQKDGKVIVGGSFQIHFIDGRVLSHLVRLNTDGSLDLSFKIGQGVNGQVTYLKEFSDGRILVAGRFTQFNGQDCKSAFVIHKDGSLDTSFQTTYGNQEIYDIALLDNNKILVYGRDGGDVKFAALVRLNPNGRVDTTFKKVSVIVKDSPVDIVPLPNEDVLFSIQDKQFQSHLYLVKPDGSVIYNNNYETEFMLINFAFTAFKRLKNGKMLMAGTFFTKSDSKFKILLRFSENGKIDQGFNFSLPTKYSNANINCIYEQEDGKIIVGGFFQGDNAETSSTIIRLNKNGSYDSSFKTDNGFDAFVTNIVKYNDNKAIVTGSFQSYGTFFTSNVARIYLEDTIAFPKPKNTWNFSFSITSNPNNGSFKIVANRVIKLVEVFDLTGKVVFSQICNSAYPEIEMRNYASGMYIVKCKSDFEEAVERMMKM